MVDMRSFQVNVPVLAKIVKRVNNKQNNDDYNLDRAGRGVNI